MKHTFLNSIVSDKKLETHWIELLSQLEFVGCRKIVKAVPYEAVTLEVLRHVHEESLHSFLLKDLAVKRAHGESHWNDNPWSPIGWEYFQRVDTEVSALVASKLDPYRLVSWVVEQRVLALYPDYLEATGDPSVKRVLRTIIAQEQRHGSQFDSLELPGRPEALEIERRAWRELEANIMACAPQLASAAYNKPPIETVGGTSVCP